MAPKASARPSGSISQVRHGSSPTRGRAAGCGAAWLARCVRDAEVAGSNPASPTPYVCADAPMSAEPITALASALLLRARRSGGLWRCGRDPVDEPRRGAGRRRAEVGGEAWPRAVHSGRPSRRRPAFRHGRNRCLVGDHVGLSFHDQVELPGWPGSTCTGRRGPGSSPCGCRPRSRTRTSRPPTGHRRLWDAGSRPG